LELDPKSPSGHFNLAIALGELNDLDGATAECRRALALRPNYFAAHHALGSFCVQLGEIEQAIASFMTAISIDPNAKITYLELGSALSCLHRLDESLACCDAAIAIDPSFIEAHEDRGSILRAMGRFQESLESYTKALSINPTSARSLFHLGKFELAIHSARNEIASAVHMVRFDSRLRSLYQVLLESLIALKRPGEAVSVLEEATSDRADEAHLHLLLGRAYLEVGDTARASESFSEAHRLNPNDKLTKCYLAQLGEGESSDDDVRNYVKELFDHYAERFDEDLLENLGCRIPWLINDAFRRHANVGDSPLTILDLGCGTGLCGPLFADIKERLVGIDLSPEMVKKAERLGVYDELIIGDIVEEMAGLQPLFHLVIAADTVVYIRDLAPVYSAANRILRPNGLLIFSIESSEGSDVSVRASMRVAHSEEYVRSLAAEESLEELDIADAVLRYDGGQAIRGKIVVLRKPPGETERAKQ
jgi:predicted TPR repeat methyltransferase